MQIMKLIGEGETIPRFYGCSYMDYRTFKRVAYPIPLNFLVGWWKILQFRLKVGSGHNIGIKAWAHGNRKGYRDGHSDGYQEGLNRRPKSL